jgi:diguanylate cyclase (GGDEF)-like protein
MDIVGRYGGEEFVFLLPETELNQAELVANRLRQKIASTVFDTTTGPVNITVSLGVAKLDIDHPDLSYLLDCSDKAMYRAKQTGRNKVVVYSKEEFIQEIPPSLHS